MISQSLPTDNLYKFIALFGLVIIIASGFYKYLAITAAQTSVSELRISQAKLPIENMNVDAMSQAKLSEWRSELSISKAKITNAKEEVAFYKLYDYRANIFMLLGFLISSAGFVLWYFKLQRYQDAGIKAKKHT